LFKRDHSSPQGPRTVQIVTPPFSGDQCERVARALAEQSPELDLVISVRKTLLRSVETTVRVEGPTVMADEFADALKDVMREAPVDSGGMF